MRAHKGKRVCLLGRDVSGFGDWKTKIKIKARSDSGKEVIH